MTINITEIIPAELSGYCDVETGECIITETGTSRGATVEIAPRADDEPSTAVNDSENS